MLYILGFGLILGLSAGITPGPLLTLVISETLQFGTKQGVKVAFAPLVSDLPIVLLTAFILFGLNQFDLIIAVVSIVGAAYLLWLGWENIRVKPIQITTSSKQSKSLIKGVFANLFNPNPYLFWLSVGLPTISKGMEESVWLSVGFVISFYVFLMGSKIVVSIVVGRSRSILTGNLYCNIIRVLGLVLWLLALGLLKEALTSLGIV